MKLEAVRSAAGYFTCNEAVDCVTIAYGATRQNSIPHSSEKMAVYPNLFILCRAIVSVGTQ